MPWKPPTNEQAFGLKPYHPLVDKLKRRERLTQDEINSIDDLTIARCCIKVLHQWDLDWGRRLPTKGK